MNYLKTTKYLYISVVYMRVITSIITIIIVLVNNNNNNTTITTRRFMCNIFRTF